MSHLNPADRSQRNERDLILIRQIQTGDSRGLDQLLRAYTGWLSEAAITYVGSSDLAQDVVQDVFISLWDRRSELHISGSVAAYLYRAIRNRSRDVLRRENTQRHIENRIADGFEGQEPQIVNSGEQDLFTEELENKIAAGLQQLPPRTREIFLMRIDIGMSYEEIAQALEIGVPTVYTQMYRATKALAKSLGKWVDGVEDGELLG